MSIGLTIMVALVAGCGGATSDAVSPIPPTPTQPTIPVTTVSATTTVSRPTTTVAPSTTDPEAATKAAVLAAYQASWADFLTVAEHNPVNALDPSLGDHMAGTELNFVRESLTGLAIRGEMDQGTVDTSRARVTQLKGTAAVVSDCDLDQTIIVNAATGAVISPAASVRTPVRETLILVEGSWKVTDGSVGQDKCS